MTSRIRAVRRLVGRRFRVSVRTLRSRSRAEPVVSYRLLGMALALECGATLTEAARLFGRRQHSTALHARRTVMARLANERATREHWLALMAQLCGNGGRSSGR